MIALCGQALCFASTEYKNHKRVVLRAVQSDGLALEYASETLQNDPEIVYQGGDI